MISFSLSPPLPLISLLHLLPPLPLISLSLSSLPFLSLSLHQYMFVTEVDPISGQAIHDELVALLIEYLDQNSKNKESMKFLNVSTTNIIVIIIIFVIVIIVVIVFVIVIVVTVFILILVCVFLSGYYSQKYGAVSWSNWKRECKQKYKQQRQQIIVVDCYCLLFRQVARADILMNLVTISVH